MSNSTVSQDDWATPSRRQFTPLDVEDERVRVLYDLWRGRVDKPGIAQLLRDKVDIGKFTADRAFRALEAIEAGKPMLARVNAILDERGEPHVNVTLMHAGGSDYGVLLTRGGRRARTEVSDDMGGNSLAAVVMDAAERLRPPDPNSFLKAEDWYTW